MSEENSRPQFLTVLCILTFIGSGLGILGSLLSLVGVGMLGSFAIAGGVIWTFLGLCSSGLCLFGAIQMWGLKKQGFLLYLIGTGLAVLSSIISTVALSDLVSYAGDSGAMWGGFIFGLAINIAFVIMYNVNRKFLVH